MSNDIHIEMAKVVDDYARWQLEWSCYRARLGERDREQVALAIEGYAQWRAGNAHARA